MASFDVNTDGAIQLTAKLEKLHRSAFPVAVRGTLNDAAFKTKSLVPKVARSKFTTRQKSFFRAFSTVDKATGFDLRNMKATAGINSAKGSEVAEGLEKQEFGGNIQGRKLIPVDSARVTKSHDRKISRRNKFRGMGKTVRIKGGGRQRTRQSRFVAAVFKAKSLGADNFILSKGNRGMLYKINRAKKLTSGKLSMKVTPLYAYRKSKISTVTKSPFMKPSAKMASKDMVKFYEKQAERQFKRLLK